MGLQNLMGTHIDMHAYIYVYVFKCVRIMGTPLQVSTVDEWKHDTQSN